MNKVYFYHKRRKKRGKKGEKIEDGEDKVKRYKGKIAGKTKKRRKKVG